MNNLDNILDSIIEEGRAQIIEIPNPSESITKAGLGLKIARDKEMKDTFFVTVKSDKDKQKLVKWMLKNGWDKTDIEDGYDELKDFLSEAKVGIQVIDPDEAQAALKKFKVNSTIRRDEVVVDTKDSAKVVKWMLNSGWDEDEIVDVYPELF